MINITIAENGAPSSEVIKLGSQFENLDEVIQFTFPTDLEPLHKYVVAKTYDPKKKENITRVTPLVNNRFVVGTAITKVVGTWMLYALCKSYAVDEDGNIISTERVSISDPIIATINENDIDVGDIEKVELDPNIKIIYDELISFKKELESNEATRQANETSRVNAENGRLSAETARAEAEANREGTISKLREDLDGNIKLSGNNARNLSGLWDLNKGISYRFENDKEKAYTKTVPSGAKLGAVNSIGGKTIVYNQYANIDGIVTGWADNINIYSDLKRLSGHKLYCMNKCIVKSILYDDRATYLKRFLLFDSDDSKNISVENTLIKKEDIQVGKVFRISKIVQAPSNLIEARVYNIGDDSIGLAVECNTWVMLIDLTQMFGEGNEPTTVEEFEAMFPNSYYPYSEGELMSMSVNEATEQGKNYFDFSKVPQGSSFAIGGGEGASTGAVTTDYSKQTITIPPKTYYANTRKTLKELCPNITQGTYIISMNRTNIDSNGFVHLYGGIGDVFLNIPTKLSNADLECEVILYNSATSENANVISNIQIERSDTATPYVPYHENHYTISQAIQNLDGYGWGVGNVYNYVDYENKKFYKYVNKVDLSTLGFVYTAYGDGNSLYGFRAPLPQGIKNDENAFSKKNNLLCSKYPDTPWIDAYNGTDKTISQLSQSIQINDSSYSDADPFKESLNGVYLYYELAEPIVTDISDIIGDTFQESINVESGGSLTFKNSNGDGYQVAVPSDIQYVVSLKEVNP